MRLENVIDWETNKQGEVIVEMTYPGGILSVNRYKFRGKFTKPEVRQWMDELAFIVRWVVGRLEVKFEPPIAIRVDGYFKDRRSMPDLHNLAKVCCDGVSEGLGIDDRHFAVSVGLPAVNPNKEPTIQITIGGTPDG